MHFKVTAAFRSRAARPKGPTGLLYDRCWALVDSSGSALRLKQHPALAGVAARVDLRRRLLVVTAAGEDRPLEVPLPEGSGAEAQARPRCAQSDRCRGGGGSSSGPAGGSSQDACSSSCSPGGHALGSASAPEPFSVRICSRTTWVRRSAASAGGDAAAAAWFSRVLGTPCRLVQQASQPSQLTQPAADPAAAVAPQQAEARAAAGPVGGGRSFANEGHLLVVGASSLADLASQAGSSEALDVFCQRFR